MLAKVAFVVPARRREEIDGEQRVERRRDVPAERRPERHVADTGPPLRLPARVHVERDERKQRMHGQRRAGKCVGCDPHDPWRHRIGSDAEVWRRDVAAVVVAQFAGAVAPRRSVHRAPAAAVRSTGSLPPRSGRRSRRLRLRERRARRRARTASRKGKVVSSFVSSYGARPEVVFPPVSRVPRQFSLACVCVQSRQECGASREIFTASGSVPATHGVVRMFFRIDAPYATSRSLLSVLAGRVSSHMTGSRASRSSRSLHAYAGGHATDVLESRIFWRRTS